MKGYGRGSVYAGITFGERFAVLWSFPKHRAELSDGIEVFEKKENGVIQAVSVGD